MHARSCLRCAADTACRRCLFIVLSLAIILCCLSSDSQQRVAVLCVALTSSSVAYCFCVVVFVVDHHQHHTNHIGVSAPQTLKSRFIQCSNLSKFVYLPPPRAAYLHKYKIQYGNTHWNVFKRTSRMKFFYEQQASADILKRKWVFGWFVAFLLLFFFLFSQRIYM